MFENLLRHLPHLPFTATTKEKEPLNSKKEKVETKKLGEFASTAICGNDILSSVLYVSGLVIPIAGVFAPLILLAVGLVLTLFRGVYREVVEAMPINGGCYNALLNGTSKNVAATAGVLTILSYVATAVISAKAGVDYLFSLFNFETWLGLSKLSWILLGTIFILTFFALLVISGIKDSATVAQLIFVFHLLTLSLFVVFGIIYSFTHPSFFAENIHSTTQLVENLNASLLLNSSQSIVVLLVIAFATSLLGVSGFESSANFVEEQQKGVFKKTLKNMLLGVILFNPLIAFLSLNISPMQDISANKDFLLAFQAALTGGSILKLILVVDSFLVLCGAVLTAFVGVSGLVNRMALDGCFPSKLGKMNKQGSFPIIILVFLGLSISILVTTGGDTASLGGVYAISFLSVMSMFAIGNLILKNTRAELKRHYSYPAVFVALALMFTLVGVFGNIVAKDGKIGDFSNFGYFVFYFIPLYFLTLIFIYRDYLTLFFLKLTHENIFAISRLFHHIVNKKYVVFIARPVRLFSILKYINSNESGRKITLVHCGSKETTEWHELKQLLPELAKAGVFPHLEVELANIPHNFGPSAVDFAEEEFKVPRNNIFVGSIHDSHKFDYEDLGGVRIII